MAYRIFAVLAFLAVIVGSVLLGGQQRETTARTTIEESGGDLGYAARKAELIETGLDGRPLYKLNADLIRQRPRDAIVELEQVKMDFRDSASNQWSARADHGELGQDTGKVELAGSVRVVGTPPGSYEAAEISTDKLAVDTREQVVTTEDPVTFTWSGRQLRARGLVASLKDRRVQLESDVHGIFSP
jgi:LPS export ABC transporter protein LptC